MKKQWPVNQSLSDQISFYLILAFLICLPADRFFGEVIFIALAAHTVIHFDKNHISRLYNPQLLIIQSVFFVTVLSTLYSVNRHHAFDEWGRQLPILLFPVLMAIHQPIIVKYKQQLLNGFAWSCVMVSLYLFDIVIQTLWYYHKPVSDIFSGSFVNHNFSRPTNIHATFLSLLLVMALVHLSQNLLVKARVLTKIITFAGAVVLMAALVQLSSKTALFSLFTVCCVFLPLYYFKGLKRWAAMGAALLITCIAFALVSRSAALKQRLVAQLEHDVDMSTAIQVTDSRLDRWLVTWETVKQRPVIGYGAGTEGGLIHQAYFEHKLYHSYMHHLDAHNQYLSFMIKSGMLGLAVYLLLLTYCLYCSWQHKNLLLAVFIILMITSSVAENVLDANKGIFFYATFFPLLLFTQKAVRRPSKTLILPEPEATKAEAVTC